MDQSHLKPIIETPGLILRHVDPARDFEALADCFSDAATMEFIGGTVMDRAMQWRHLATFIGNQNILGYFFYSVIDKATGQWVGRVGHWSPEGWPEPQVGWTIHRNHWRKGYAKEATEACVKFAFERLGWSRVIHVIDEANIASQKTAEAIGSAKL